MRAISSGRTALKERDRLCCSQNAKVSFALTATSLLLPTFMTAQAQVAPQKPVLQIAPSALAQIGVLQAEKANRTPAQRKMSSRLIYANKKLRDQNFARSLPDLRTNVNMSTDGKVRVEIMGNVSKDLTQHIISLGGTIEVTYDKIGLILATLPLDKAENVAARSDVRFIRPASQAFTSGNWRTQASARQDGAAGSLATPAANIGGRASRLSETERKNLKTRMIESMRGRNFGGAIRNGMTAPARIGKSKASSVAVGNSLTPGASQGSVVSQGDAVHRAAEARADFQTDGAGIKIGVLSDGVNTLTNSQSTGDLGPVTVLPGQAGNGNEGTAMLEIVHDIAPGAQLYFATATVTQAGFAQNIRDLRAAGCDIIVDDIIYLNESPFQDGPVAQAVIEVMANGALYFSSAGNEGNKNDGASGTWEGNFVPNGTIAALPANAGEAHNFGDGGQSIRVVSGSSQTPPILIWAEHYTLTTGSASTDFDLYDLNSTLTTVFEASTDRQDGTGDNDFPVEYLGGGAFANERLVVTRFNAGTTTSVPMFNLIVFRGRLDNNLSTSGATRGHSAADGAYSVAAVPAADSFDGVTPDGPFPGPFTAANASESFTSDGTRRIILSPTGVEITPDNRTSTGGTVRQKPDIAAADGVTTTSPGFAPFYGTSASAPHAAAIAALIKSHAPSLTPAQIRTALTNSAIDIETAGVDRDTGAGIVMAYQALEATGIAPPRELSYVSNNVRVDGGNLNSRLEPNECNLLDVTLTTGRLDAGPITSVSSTLSTTTPGVTITRATSAYPDFASRNSHTNTVPFQVSTDSGFVCGTTVAFTLTVTSSDGTFTFPFSIQTGVSGAANGFEATDVPIAIPDSTTTNGSPPGPVIESSIPVSGFSGLLGKVTVSLYITHTFDNDLDISLVAPDGTIIKLIRDVGDNGDNFGTSPALADRTVLDDDAATSIATRTTAASAPHVGTFRPLEPLSVLRGRSDTIVNGSWKLRVQDRFKDDTGSLMNWGLTLAPLTCTDGGGACNAAPSLSNVSLTTSEDTIYTFAQTDFDAGFNDPNGDFVQKVRIDSLSADGILKLSGVDVTVGQEIDRAALVNLTFAPTANFNGTTSFNWNGNDGLIYAATGAQVVFNVTPVNDAPTVSDIPVQTTSEDTATAAIPFTIGDIDNPVANLTLTATSSDTTLVPNANIVLGGSGANRTVTITPIAQLSGTTTISITVSDGPLTANDTFVLTVTPVNDAPVAANQTVNTAEETARTITLTATDIDNVNLTYTVVAQPAYGTLSGTAPDLAYTPALNYNGTDSFTFKASDGVLDSNIATITINVGGTNDAPVGVDDSYSSIGASLSVPAPGVLANDTDVDGDILTATLKTGPAHGTLDLKSDGSFTFTPNIDSSGPDSFTYTVSDGLATATATVNLTIEDAPQSPRLTLTIAPAAFNENAGPAAALATLTRNVEIGTRLTVQVVSSNHREARVPATIDIPSGAKTTQFWIGAIDDGIVDGTKNVTIAALATGYPRITQQIQVRDNRVVLLPLQLRVKPSGFAETDGVRASIGEVSIPVPAKVDYAIELVSSDESEVRVPKTVTIKAGLTKATFYIAAVDDKIADGTQTVILTAKRLGFGTANSLLKVSDDETRSLLLTTESDSVREGGFIIATLTRNWAINSAMTVILSNTAPSAAQVASAISIPAGATSVTFPIYGVANSINGDVRSVAITASRPGLTSDTVILNVVDTAQPAPFGAASKVALSTASADTATQSVTLKFGATLNADALNVANFAVLVDGVPVAVEGISYNAAASSVKLLLASGSLKSGERVEVSWNDLLDNSNLPLRGQTRTTAR